MEQRLIGTITILGKRQKNPTKNRSMRGFHTGTSTVCTSPLHPAPLPCEVQEYSQKEDYAAHPCTAGKVAASSLTQLSSIYYLSTPILYGTCRDAGSNFAFSSSSGQEGTAGSPLRYDSEIITPKCLEPLPCRGHQGVRLQLGLNVSAYEAGQGPGACFSRVASLLQREATAVAAEERCPVPDPMESRLLLLQDQCEPA